MTKPLISIIIPVYNMESYLDRCLETVAGQTYQNLDIILIDDGSRDNCPKMCDAWAARDSRIRVIHKANGGLAQTRNLGLREARGEYVAFVDSDDWISPVMLEKLEEAMEQSGAELVMCQYTFVRLNGHEESFARKGHAAEFFSAESALKELLKGSKMTNHVWRSLYKREVIPLDVFPTGKYYEDVYATYQILANCTKIVYLNEAYYFYRENAKGIAQTLSIPSLMDYHEILQTRRQQLLRRFPGLRTAVEHSAVYETFTVWVLMKRSQDRDPKREVLEKDLRKEISTMSVRAIMRALPAYSAALAGYALSLRLCPWSEKLSDAILFSKNAAIFRLVRKVRIKFQQKK